MPKIVTLTGGPLDGLQVDLSGACYKHKMAETSAEFRAGRWVAAVYEWVSEKGTIAGVFNCYVDMDGNPTTPLWLPAVEGKYGIITASKKTFHPAEPVFLLRATDKGTVKTVLKYAEFCDEMGCDVEHVKAIRAHAKRIAAWQTANPGLVKIPD